MARIYYSRIANLNTQVKYEGVQVTELGREVLQAKYQLLNVVHPNNYTPEEWEEFVKITIANIDGIDRAKDVCLPIKAEMLAYEGGSEICKYTPTPLEGFLMNARTRLSSQGKAITGNIKKFKKDKIFLTHMKDVVYEEVPQGTKYSIDVEKIIKEKQKKSRDEDVIEEITSEGKVVKILGKKVGRKKKIAMAV